MKNKEYLCIGKVVGTRGIRGEIKVEPWCDYPENFYDIENIYIDINSEPLSITSLRVHKRQVLLSIEGIDCKNSAEILRGKHLYAYKKDIPLEEGRYFIEDLKGCAVFHSESGIELGILKDVFNTGANDIYSIVNLSKKEYLVPIIDGTVKEINIEEHKIIINPIRGIFDE